MRSELLFEADFKALIGLEQMNRLIVRKAVVEPCPGGRHERGWAMRSAKILDFMPDHRLAVVDAKYPNGRPPNVLTWTLPGGEGRTRLTLSMAALRLSGPQRHLPGLAQLLELCSH